MSKLITIFGATGNQGGSVINSILTDPQLSNEFKIRGVTRDATKKSAQDLANRGVELVTADLNSIDSLTAAIKGSDIVFLVTNYWEILDPNVEYAQGKNVADICKALCVSHLIFSSLSDVQKGSKGRLTHLPHFDSKVRVEGYIRDSGIGCSFILAGYYMSNFKKELKRAEDGSYQVSFPVGKHAKFPLFDAAQDTGLFVKAILKHAGELKNKQILAATSYYTPEEIVEIISRVSGKKTAFIQISNEQYMAPLPPGVGQELVETHLCLEDPGYYLGEPLEPSLNLLDSKPTPFERFVEINFSTWEQKI